jgi:hypothetical protein
MHRPRFDSNGQGYSHINVQERTPPYDDLTDPKVEAEDFVRNESLQDEIEEQLLSKNKLPTNKETPNRPLTFAEATMSTKRGRGDRKDSIKDVDARLAGPVSLDCPGPFTYTFKKKKKKHNKWSPFDLSVADSASEAGSNSEACVDVGSSRAVSPNPQPNSGSASFSSSPQRSHFNLTSTVLVASVSPTDKEKPRFIEKAELDFNVLEESHQTHTQNTVDFATQTAKDEGKNRSIEEAELDFDDIRATQTPILDSFKFAGQTAQDKGRARFVKEAEVDLNDIGDTHQKPIQDSFEFAARVSVPNLFSRGTEALPTRETDRSPDEVESATSDTSSTRERTEAAMASIAGAFDASKAPKVGEDLFDSIEWDPDLPSASASDSPELVESVIAAPQPLAYTTVGSLVNPNAVPQFTAPNRIQREGAGRRPLMTFMQNRPLILNRYQEPTYFHPREVPPLLNMQDSMNYAQQLAQSSIQLHQAQHPISSHFSRAAVSRQQMSLTDEEMKVLKRVGGPQMVPGNIYGSPATRNQFSKPFPSMITSENKQRPGHLSAPNVFTTHQDLSLPTLLPSNLIEDGQHPSTALSGLEKMQTIQRLAKFENPMQQLARSRLSALSVTNHLGRTVANPTGLQIPSSTSGTLSHKLPAATPGELDRGYQFPPPGFGTSSIALENPLFGAYGASTLQSPPVNRTSGVPQPLTAGPPGQRQSNTATSTKISPSLSASRQLGGDGKNVSTSFAEYMQNVTADPQSQFYHLSFNFQRFSGPLSQDLKMESQISAPTHQPRAPVYDGEIVGSKLLDSLPIAMVAIYYPDGFPSNLTGHFTSPSCEMRVTMDQIPSVRKPVTAEGNEAARRKAFDDWFYGGQREYGKTTADHINDMAHREEVRRGSSFGPIGPPPKKFVEKKPITEEEMNNMPTAEAAKPLVDALFRTLLAYADESFDSESRRHLSGFVKPPEFLIDNSDKGNMSFFGEDWGAPPKRGLGVSQRYQSTFHGPSTTN